MIGKTPATGTGFRGLTSYLMRGRRDAPDKNRVAWSLTRNLLTDDPEFAPRLMRSTASMSNRCKKPVYHLVIAWRADENPSEDMMRVVGETTIADLDLSEHQQVFIAHQDTEHKHLHIIVNRVHPETGKAWHKSKDWARIEVSLRRQSEALGFDYVPGRHNDPDKFRDVPRQARDGEVQANIRHGKDKPLPQLSKEQIVGRRVLLGPAFENAASWDDLQHGLAEHGMRLTAKGQGLVLTGDDGFMKLSDMGKQIRLGVLEERFGESFSAYDQRQAMEPAQEQREPAQHQDEAAPASPRKSRTAPPKERAMPQQRRKPDEADESAEQRDLDEELREQQRAEARQRRAERVASMPAGSSAAATEDDTPPLARDNTTAPSPQPEPPQTPRAEAFDALEDARDTHSLARAMHKMGILNKEDIKSSKDELAAARKNLDPHLTLQEKMDQGVWDALKTKPPGPKQKQPSEADKQMAKAKEQQKLERKKKRKQKQKDKDRDDYGR